MVLLNVVKVNGAAAGDTGRGGNGVCSGNDNDGGEDDVGNGYGVNGNCGNGVSGIMIGFLVMVMVLVKMVVVLLLLVIIAVVVIASDDGDDEDDDNATGAAANDCLTSLAILNY